MSPPTKRCPIIPAGLRLCWAGELRIEQPWSNRLTGTRSLGHALYALYSEGAMRTWQVQEARRQFRQLFDDAAEKGPQRVCRQGKQAVVVISEDEWRRLSEGVPSFGDLLAACPIEPEDLPERRPARAIRERLFE